MQKCDNEDKLIKEAVSGNADSFGELVRHYESFVFNVAFSYMTSREDAFDVAQEAFIKAWRKLYLFKGDSAFSTWLYRITTNTAKDALAIRNRRWQETAPDEKIPSPHETPEEKIVRDESIEELKKGLSMLDEDAREILVLREFEQLSYIELSEKLGIELGTVKSRLNRARARLCEILREQNSKIPVKMYEKE